MNKRPRRLPGRPAKNDTSIRSTYRYTNEEHGLVLPAAFPSVIGGPRTDFIAALRFL
jgi:hypothetical protein